MGEINLFDVLEICAVGLMIALLMFIVMPWGNERVRLEAIEDNKPCVNRCSLLNLTGEKILGEDACRCFPDRDFYTDDEIVIIHYKT
jgi:hypothetical protein